jgi:2-methylcitrate dehydratase PrpD
MEKLVAEKLARWAVNLRPEALPEDVLAKAEDVIIDAIACALVGSRTEGAQRVHNVARSTLFGKGDAILWFDTVTLHPTAAAFANSASASMLDLDDGHRNALGHPGAAIVPAILAFAYPDDKGIDVLCSIVAAYEVCIRIGCSERQKAYHTGNWSGLGASVAAGLGLGLNSDQLMNALVVIAYHGPRVSDLTLSQDMGANVKESIPWSVVTGLMANDLAAQGFTGCRDALNIEERYDPVVSLKGLAEGRFHSHMGPVSHAILRTYFKRYACCRWIHSPVEALLQIMREQDISAEEVENISVETFLQAANLNNLTDPPSIESLQYSVPYCMAIAAILGEDALSPATSECLHRTEIIKFAEKISVGRDLTMDSSYPFKTPSRVSVTTAKGTFVAMIEELWGDPDRALARADLVGKFKTLSHGLLSNNQVMKIVSGVEGLRGGKVGPLLDALRSAVPMTSISSGDRAPDSLTGT